MRFVDHRRARGRDRWGRDRGGRGRHGCEWGDCAHWVTSWLAIESIWFSVWIALLSSW